MSKVCNVPRSMSAVLATFAILPALPGSTVAGATTPVLVHEVAQVKGSWSLQPVPAPAKARSLGLGAVSCPSANTCSAVGAYTGTAGAAVAVAEDWNGAKWSVQPTVSLTGVSSSQLSAVSCAAVSACMAVGQLEKVRSGSSPLAEKWDGRAWELEATPVPSASQYPKLSDLAGVSCWTASACTAVGTFTNSSQRDQALAEHWNGSRWSVQSVPSPAGTWYLELDGVSCSGSACMAVGSVGTSPSAGAEDTLAEHWGGGAQWTVNRPLNPPNEIYRWLYGVSCPSARSCFAVGTEENSSGTYSMLSEHWDGTAWSLLFTPSPPSGGKFRALFAVSCPSLTTCTAVGYQQTAYGYSTVAERLNGTRWRVQPTPNPEGKAYTELYGVDCTYTTRSNAVGPGVAERSS